jgi:hypothetical protein
MSQEIDYTRVLADLEARRAALDAAIAGVRALLGQPADAAGAVSVPGTPGQALEWSEIGPGTFHGMSVSEASRKFLEMTKKKQKTRVIAEALVNGGIESESKSFYSTVYTTMQRNKDFLRLGKYWALREWYPTRAEAAPKPTKRGRRTKLTRGPKGQRQAPGASSQAATVENAE